MTKSQLVGLSSITDRLDARSSNWYSRPREYKHPRYHTRAMENVTHIERKSRASTPTKAVNLTTMAPTLSIRG